MDVICASFLLDVGAVHRGRRINPAIRLIRIERNKLDSNRGGWNRAFIPDDVHVTVTGID